MRPNNWAGRLFFGQLGSSLLCLIVALACMSRMFAQKICNNRSGSYDSKAEGVLRSGSCGHADNFPVAIIDGTSAVSAPHRLVNQINCGAVSASNIRFGCNRRDNFRRKASKCYRSSVGNFCVIEGHHRNVISGHALARERVFYGLADGQIQVFVGIASEKPEVLEVDRFLKLLPSVVRDINGRGASVFDLCDFFQSVENVRGCEKATLRVNKETRSPDMGDLELLLIVKVSAQ